MPKPYVKRWLIDMLEDGPYRDEREVKAEQRQIRANARQEIDKIWTEQQQKLAPPPVAPLAPPTWGVPQPSPPSFQESAPSTFGENLPLAETPSGDPGIGVVSRLADDYWTSGAPPLGQVETI